MSVARRTKENREKPIRHFPCGASKRVSS